MSDLLFSGYNCSLFAYGQTGAGKSYSMMGYGEDKGIIPIASQEIFERINRNEDPDLTFRVETSMLEIYMEKVRQGKGIAEEKKGNRTRRGNRGEKPWAILDDGDSCLFLRFATSSIPAQRRRRRTP